MRRFVCAPNFVPQDFLSMGLLRVVKAQPLLKSKVCRGIDIKQAITIILVLVLLMIGDITSLGYV